MKYTIKDLAEGKCAVINEGTLEELRQVLGTAFPNQSRLVRGEAVFYFLYEEGEDAWTGENLTNLPAQSVRDFLMTQPIEESLEKIISQLKSKSEELGLICTVTFTNK
jgi:hypothetical protein